jgi:hypothetical protein
VGACDGVERGVALESHEALFGAQLVDSGVQRRLECGRLRRALGRLRGGAERLHQQQREPHADQETSRLAERARH